MRTLRSLATILLSGCAWAAFAQAQEPKSRNRVEILNADRWEYDKELATGAQRLIGNVRFRQDDALMACDSAYLYEDERVSAFGNVRLTQGDTLRITGERLLYSGADRTARMSGNVHLSDPSMELTTEALLYDVRGHRAEYNAGARIISKRDGNTLTSGKGAYYADSRLFIFSDSVRLSHPERTIEADTLHYATASGIAEFLGPTHITQGKVRMYCERGSYNTRTGKGRFTKAARIASEGQVLTGDSLHYDRTTGEGAGWGHVSITDTVNDLLVRGRIGRHNQTDGRSMVTGRAEMVMIMGDDSLFLHADTLFAKQDSLGQRRVDARRNVRFFKSDLQGVCDTMTYVGADSLITLRGHPFIWSRTDQISGDTVRIKLRDGHAETLFVDGAAFMISQVDSLHFNQVTGLTMIGRFHNDELTELIAEGNSRTVYFAKETKDSVEQVTGVNRTDCSRITVGLDSGKVSTVSFITQPTATLYPLDQAPIEELRLEGFHWNAAARPEDRADIFRETPVGEVPVASGGPK
jgi:lipopolysaccharide export system protein LptA